VVPGFHGTSSKRAERILDEGFDLNRGANGWFGKGAYFWEGDAFLCKVPAERAVKEDGGRQAVLVASITLTETCLDLITKAGKKRYRRVIQTLFKELRNDISLHREFLELPAQDVDAFVIDFAEEVLDLSFPVIRAITYPGKRHYTDEAAGLPVTRFPMRESEGTSAVQFGHALVNFGIHLVVKDSRCIQSKEEHDGIS
jgi:hypothetical protein